MNLSLPDSGSRVNGLEQPFHPCRTVTYSTFQMAWEVIEKAEDKDRAEINHRWFKNRKALKNLGHMNKLELEDSAWGFMAVESIIEVFEGRKARNDQKDSFS